jgi:acylphosphatase
MITFKVKRRKLSGIVINLSDAIVEVIKDGEVVAMIYPTIEGIKISFQDFISLEASNGTDMVPPTPTIFLKF